MTMTLETLKLLRRVDKYFEDIENIDDRATPEDIHDIRFDLKSAIATGESEREE